MHGGALSTGKEVFWQSIRWPHKAYAHVGKWHQHVTHRVVRLNNVCVAFFKLIQMKFELGLCGLNLYISPMLRHSVLLHRLVVYIRIATLRCHRNLEHDTHSTATHILSDSRMSYFEKGAKQFEPLESHIEIPEGRRTHEPTLGCENAASFSGARHWKNATAFAPHNASLYYACNGMPQNICVCS